MNVSLTNGWGIVRTIADLALSRPEGKYVLVKDPNHVSLPCWMPGYDCLLISQPTLRMYQVPDNAFDADDMIMEEE
jgi:translation initiation factor 3 subunit D